MIAIFLNKTDAQKYADKIHEWLQQNCPNYSAIKWQDPVSNKDVTQFYVEIPQEYYKLYYPKSPQIVTACKTEYDKNSEVKEKPDPDWGAVTTPK